MRDWPLAGLARARGSRGEVAGIKNNFGPEHREPCVPVRPLLTALGGQLKDSEMA